MRRIELEVVCDTTRFRHALHDAERLFARVLPPRYAGRGYSTPQFERMVRRIASVFGRVDAVDVGLVVGWLLAAAYVVLLSLWAARVI